ncbi:MAG: ABC transporter permease [Desulfovibrio sp.]|uniref:ABC transporter permease n=1 Tax=Desulfovibrio sp. TaxID=885 RepID=UPI0039E404AB
MPAQTDKSSSDTASAAAPSVPAFTFRRMAGLDQALLSTDAEWQSLGKLDPKLWMALSCPIHGLEFDAQTLALLDADNDRRIRAKEILDAVAWLCQRISHPSHLKERRTALPLDLLREDTPEGASILAAARLVLDKTEAADRTQIDRHQTAIALNAAAGYAFNGDGIVPSTSVDAQDASGEAVRHFILTGLKIVGGMRDDSGTPGLDAPLAARFREILHEVLQWRQKTHEAELPLGRDTDEAWSLMQRLGPKIDDYFARCRMAAFAPQTLPALNEENEIGLQESPEARLFSMEHLGRRPLARIAAGQPLDLQAGINPAWEKDMRAFRRLFEAVLPLTKDSQNSENAACSLDEDTWRAIQNRFTPYAALLAQKPDFARAPEDATPFNAPGQPPLALAAADDPLGRAFLPLNPEEVVDKLSDADLDALLSTATEEAFDSYIKRDLAAPRMDAMRDLEKLILLHANLYTLLMNFVSFADFYEPGNRAIFLAGTLYIDSRSCSLCVHVDDVDSHVRLATQSHLCLLYCLCVRKGSNGEEQTATIAAALTAGTADDLIEGRHGIFVDNAGQVWDSTLLRIVRNPISLREAMWAPYIRFANLVGGQLHKLVAAKDTAIANASSKLAGSVAEGQPEAPAKAPQAKQPFDIAKSAGIFAAVSVGISMVSASFTYIAKSLFSLGWWWPMALLCVFIVISGPSMAMAWFKLRRRSLGPLLDASGWAVNTGAPINFTMGGTLTAVGEMPPGAQRSLDDPYGLPAQLKHSRTRRIAVSVLALLLLAAAGLGGYWAWKGEAPSWIKFWQNDTRVTNTSDGKGTEKSGQPNAAKPASPEAPGKAADKAQQGKNGAANATAKEALPSEAKQKTGDQSQNSKKTTDKDSASTTDVQPKAGAAQAPSPEAAATPKPASILEAFAPGAGSAPAPSAAQP